MLIELVLKELVSRNSAVYSPTLNVMYYFLTSSLNTPESKLKLCLIFE